MLKSDLHFFLPPAQIAQAPLTPRDASRLLVCKKNNALLHAHVRDLDQLLEKPTLIVVNQSRVLPARILTRKATGGEVEILLLECLQDGVHEARWSAFAKPKKTLREGMELTSIHGALQVRIDRLGSDREIEVTLLSPATSVDNALQEAGTMPLPPYIARPANEQDDDRYQTIFAQEKGSVAAPTAGLHFTPELVERLKQKGHSFAEVTLHVGAGTFLPISSDTLDGHVMHEERYEVPESTRAAIANAKAEGREVLAVGTTVVRTLESAAASGTLQSGKGRTRIFIQPPYEFRVVDRLLTNFHLPESTLLALVMAFAGIENTRNAYQTAVAEGYRFFSYGDAMLLERS